MLKTVVDVLFVLTTGAILWWTIGVIGEIKEAIDKINKTTEEINQLNRELYQVEDDGK